MTTEIKLTEREVAIAQGLDPDTVETSTESVETPGDGDASSDVSPEAPDEPAGTDWVDDDAKDLAASYGLSDDDLKAFSSVDDLRKHTFLIDKQIYDEASAAKKDSETEVKEEKQAKDESAAAADDDLIDPKKYADEGYDEETVKLATALRRQQEKNQEAMKLLEELNGWRKGFEEDLAQQEMIQVTNEFHRALDSMGDDRFGRAYDDSGRVTDLNKDAHSHREKVWEAMKVLENGIYARAKEKGVAPSIPPRDVLVRRAYQLAFPEAVQAAKRQQTIDTAKAQSAKRRPVGNQGGTRTRPVDATDVNSLAKHPDIEQWWKDNVLS